jgi:long-chain acyl-CoA synthetase
MSFLADIFGSLERARDTVVLQEGRDGENVSVTGGELLELMGRARSFLSRRGLRRGDRCALFGHNGIRWVALDLAIMAEGLIVVPLYARQAAEEVVAMMKDCSPALVCCGNAGLRDGIAEHWADGPPLVLFDEIFAASAGSERTPSVADSDPVSIIYTSGTSGEAKGVVLTAVNVGHMLGCTSGRLDLLNQTRRAASLQNVNDGRDRVFHYLPFCFAGSWIMLLTCLLRGSLLTLNTDLTKLAGEMRGVGPDYFLNVPALLERMRRAVDEQIWKTGGVIQFIYGRAKAAWARNFAALSLQESKSQERRTRERARLGDRFFLWLAGVLVFPTIRKKMIGSNLKALICGSAPLNMETQLYFMMLGIPVLQVYGLTETTAICTMDDPRNGEPGRVGPAIEGVEMRLGENEEILVRGPNVFPGYWKREQETAKVLRGGWFHTGDQGEVNAEGNWRIVGRIKNLIVLGSGHNVAPEPIEDEIARELGGEQQVVLVGNGRGYLCALVTGAVAGEQVQAALDSVNAALPHYKQVRGFYISSEPFSIENGMLTANGKLKRDVIASRFREEIEELYGGKSTEYRVPGTEYGARRSG